MAHFGEYKGTGTSCEEQTWTNGSFCVHYVLLTRCYMPSPCMGNTQSCGLFFLVLYQLVFILMFFFITVQKQIFNCYVKPCGWYIFSGLTSTNIPRSDTARVVASELLVSKCQSQTVI